MACSERDFSMEKVIVTTFKVTSDELKTLEKILDDLTPDFQKLIPEKIKDKQLKLQLRNYSMYKILDTRIDNSITRPLTLLVKVKIYLVRALLFSPEARSITEYYTYTIPKYRLLNLITFQTPLPETDQLEKFVKNKQG